MDEQDTLMYQDIKCVVEKHFADPFMESRLSWSIRTIDRFRAKVEALRADAERFRALFDYLNTHLVRPVGRAFVLGDRYECI